MKTFIAITTATLALPLAVSAHMGGGMGMAGGGMSGFHADQFHGTMIPMNNDSLRSARQPISAPKSQPISAPRPTPISATTGKSSAAPAGRASGFGTSNSFQGTMLPPVTNNSRSANAPDGFHGTIIPPN